MAPDAAAAYKARKEAFVSNLSGGTLTEINVVTIVAAAALLLWTALQKRHSFFTPYTALAFFQDFLLNVCAILFAFTIYSSAPIILSVSLITPAVLILALSPANDNGKNGPSPSKSKSKSKPAKTSPPSTNGTTNAAAAAAATSAQNGPFLPVRPFLTHYRGSMLVATTLAILAVDFPIFPRRFAKVETWGTSLMDLGVGSFVFSGGVVSARTLLKPSSTGTGTGTGTRASFTTRLASSLRHSVPLIVLGLIRLWSVKGLDYAEHVTEYGVHWNFFFTLGLLGPFVELSDLVTQTVFRYHDVTALVLTGAYELALQHTPLLRFILGAPRTDLLSQNREGLFSFLGYLAIFLAGRGTGRGIIAFRAAPSPASSASSSKHAAQNSPTQRTRAERLATLAVLLRHALVYIALFAVATHYYGLNLRVSRRLANLPYVLWVVAFNNAQVLLFGLIEHIGPDFAYAFLQPPSGKDNATTQPPEDATSVVMRAFNANGLAVFLVANLGTGLVNLSVDTLGMSPLKSMGVLVVYAALVTGVAVGMDRAGLRVKL